MKKERSESILRNYGNTFVVVIMAFMIGLVYFGNKLIMFIIENYTTLTWHTDVIVYSLSRIFALIILIIIAKIFGLTKEIKWFSKDFLLTFGLLSFLVLYALGRLSWNMSFNSDVEIDYKFLVLLVFYTLSIGFYEEFCFRGIVFEAIKKKYYLTESFFAIIVQGLLFGLAHFTNYFAGGKDLPIVLSQVFHSMLVGIMIGISYDTAHNLFACSLIHAFWDFSLMYSTAYKKKVIYSEIPYPLNLFLIIAAFLFYIVSAAIVYYRRKEKNEMLKKIISSEVKEY